MLAKRWTVPCVASLLLLGIVCTAKAEPRGQKHGFLGVYVVEGNNGMVITDFIEGTPAYKLYKRGKIDVNCTIVRLAGETTESLDELREARDSIPRNKEGKLIFLDDDGDAHHLWISPRSKNGGYAATRRGGAAEPGGDGWSSPAPGRGDADSNIRDLRNADGAERDGGNPDIR